jgi:uncharacterized protein YkwD
MRRSLSRSTTFLVLPLALVALVLATMSPASAGAGSKRASWAVPKTAPSTPIASKEDFENRLMIEINNARRANGVSRISRFDVCADRMAERWGSRLARSGLFEHRNQSIVIQKCDAAWAGENLIRGTQLTPASMVDAWLNSPGHRAILLSPRASRAGVSVVQDNQGRMIGVLNVVRPMR